MVVSDILSFTKSKGDIMKKFLFKIMAFAVMLGASFCLIGCGDNSFTSSVTVSQQEGEQSVLVQWDTSRALDKVEITVTHNGELVSSKIITSSGELSRGGVDIGAFYGKHTVTTTLYSKNAKNVDSKEIKVSAKEYNIAPLSGSLPVLMFTLSSLQDDGLMKNSSGKTIPTFVWLDRSLAYDWTKLPQGFYTMPNATVEEYTTPNVNKDLMYRKTKEYIKELISLDSSSKINLFLNDYDAEKYLELIVATGLDDANYTCTYLSDGSFSYSIINSTFNVADATAKYDQMKTNYLQAKQQIKDKGYFNNSSEFAITGNIQEYLLVIANEDDNVEWWFPRLRSGHINLTNDTTNLKNTKIFQADGTTKQPSLKEYGLGTFLTNIEKDAEKSQTLKELYKFNDDMFAQAKEQNKKVMMLLGTKAKNDLESNFEDYTNFVKSLYGDEYVYYYKGHPDTPTYLYPERAQKLEQMGLIDIESTINAELILFYFPDIYMSGYSSSTFNAITNDDMACVYWGTTKANALAKTDVKGGGFNAYITPATSAYDSIVTSGHRNYLVEFTDTTNYDFAIYDATEDKTTYYKQDGSDFTVVNK